MYNIYRYNDDFSNDKVISKINEISEQIQENISKRNADEEKIKKLIYAQFVQGLKLSIG